MPRYEYSCVQCGHRFEVLQSFPSQSIDPGISCPACGSRGIVEALQEYVDTYPLDGSDVLKYLPRTNCGECVASNCSDFARLLLDGSVRACECRKLKPDLGDLLQKVVDFQPQELAYDTMMPAASSTYYAIGSPDLASPVLVTGNFLGTLNLLRSILENARIDAHLIASDTHGFAVDNAVEAKWFRAYNVFTALSPVAARVAHSTLIIPGLAASLKGDIQRVTRWRVVVGPTSGYELPLFLFHTNTK